jgi:hypothetical protein
MRIGRGNRSTRRKPATVPLCRPQIPHDLGSNPRRRGGKPATNRLSYGTACSMELLEILGEEHKLRSACMYSFILSLTAVQPFVGPWPFLQFRIFFTQTVGHLDE